MAVQAAMEAQQTLSEKLRAVSQRMQEVLDNDSESFHASTTATTVRLQIIRDARIENVGKRTVLHGAKVRFPCNQARNTATDGALAAVEARTAAILENQRHGPSTGVERVGYDLSSPDGWGAHDKLRQQHDTKDYASYLMQKQMLLQQQLQLETGFGTMSAHATAADGAGGMALEPETIQPPPSRAASTVIHSMRTGRAGPGASSPRRGFSPPYGCVSI